MGLFASKEERDVAKQRRAAESQRINEAVEERMRRQEEAEREEYLKTHSAEIQAKHKKFVASGLAVHEYTDDVLDSLIDAELEGVYNSMPGAWTGLAMTLTGSQSSNEIINTLRVMIKQNSVLIKQNEMIIRELRRARKE